MRYSVIIPAFNAENTLSRTLDSIIQQNKDDIEIIVVNDGSTDNTAQVVEEYNDQRIRLIDKNNTGVSDSRNIGIEYAKGEYLIFCDSDDLLPVRYLVNLDEKLDSISFSPDIIFGWYKRFDSYSGAEIDCTFDYDGDLADIGQEEIWQVLFCHKKIFSMPIMAQVYRRNFIVENELYFDINQFVSEDHDWRYSLLNKANRFYNCKLCMYLYCYNNQFSVTNTEYSLKKYKNSIRYLNKWYKCCANDEVNKKTKNILLDLISQDYINHAIRINDIRNINDKKYAIKCFKENDELMIYAKPLKYKISVILYKAIGAKNYITIINRIHMIKSRVKRESQY